jgi:hypothetical protein
VRMTGAHFILYQSDQPSLGFSYIDVPQRCRIAPRFQIVLCFVQDLTPILERFAIDLCAALRIEIRHRHLRSNVYVCLRLSEDARMGRHDLLRTPSPCLTLSTSITKCFREIDLCSMRKRTEANQYRSIYRRIWRLTTILFHSTKEVSLTWLQPQTLSCRRFSDYEGE